MRAGLGALTEQAPQLGQRFGDRSRRISRLEDSQLSPRCLREGSGLDYALFRPSSAPGKCDSCSQDVLEAPGPISAPNS